MWMSSTYRQLLKQVVLTLLLIHTLGECHRINWDFMATRPEDDLMQFSNYPLSNPVDNGAAQILIDVFTNRLLEDMFRQRSEDRLTADESQILKNRLKGLYAYLKNQPALMDRRLQVGSIKPEIPQEIKHNVQKRLFEHSLAEPICPSRTEWLQLRYARDINDTDVEIFQPEGIEGHQWFYTVKCDSQREYIEDPDCPLCCRGIPRSRYASRCITKKSYVMAYVRRLTDTEFDWNWIQVDSSCNCAISEYVVRK